MDGQDLSGSAAGERSPRQHGPDFVDSGLLARGLPILLVFLVGVAVGFPAATLGVPFLVDNAVPVIAALIAVLVVALIVVGLIVLYRRRLWNALFRRGEVEAHRLAGPLADFARHAAEHRANEAALSAREFGELAIARYAWIMTRRWLLSTVSALVVAIAALAGAALLFQQNQLLRDQSGLLAEQNERISDQTALLEAQIQLGEAQRSTAIVPEILAIGASIGAETAALTAAAPGRAIAAADLSDSLRARIVAASNAARPYRHVQSPLSELSELEITASAVARRTDLPLVLADYEAWQAQQPGARSLAALGTPTGELTDREVSPERGQLISLLYNSGIADTAILSAAGADFSFSELRQPLLADMSFRFAMLRFADFSRLAIRDVDFRGARLDQMRFRAVRISAASFSSLAPAETPGGTAAFTQMHGTDFTGAVIYDTAFRAAWIVAGAFDAAFLGSVDFTEADLSAATFRGAIILDTTFDGAELGSVDLSDAIVFTPDFLTLLATVAEPGSFVADRYRLDPIDLSQLADHPLFEIIAAELPGLLTPSLTPYQVVRIADFESEPNRGGIISP